MCADIVDDMICALEGEPGDMLKYTSKMRDILKYMKF